MPRSPLAPISTAEEVRPAAPMSWMAMTAPVAISSRQASSSSFSAKGSPTCTVGRLAAHRRRRRPRPWRRRRCRRGRSSSRGRRWVSRRPSPWNRRSVRAGEAHRHGVDEDVAVVGGVEGDAAAHRRHAEGIAVAADAGHDAGHEVARLRVVGRAEAQHVEAGDRPRPHGEHVAQDAADPRRRALVGLDEGGVVVALHLEHAGEPVADVDHAGVLARALDHLRRRRWAGRAGAGATTCRSSARSTWPTRCRARSRSGCGRPAGRRSARIRRA